MLYYISTQVNNFEAVKPATMEDLVAWLTGLEDKTFGLDLETSGLDFIGDRTLLAAIGNTDTQFVINKVDTDLEPIRPFLESKEYLKILHNSSFDYKFLRSIGITLFNTYDTMLAEQVLTNGKAIKSYSLGAVTYFYLNKGRDKSLQTSFIGKTDSIFSESQIEYAGDDTGDLVEIMRKQLVRAKTLELTNTILLENSSTLAFADIEFNGIKLDKDAWMELYKDALLKSIEQRKKLDDTILFTPELSKFKANYQLDFFIPEEEVRKVDINWSSPTQVLKVLQVLFPAIPNTKEEEVSKYLHPLTEALLTYKGLVKRTGTYGETFLDHLYPDGKIRTSFKRILATGRVSSAGPNMQQIPADNRYRNCFIPSSPENVIVSADYKSQELALIAFESQDPVWLEALGQGQDLHSVCAELVYGQEWDDAAEDDCAYFEDIEGEVGDMVMTVTAREKCDCKGHKRMRKNVKTINFGLAYGMSAPTLSERLRISLTEAEGLIRNYFQAFPSIHGYLEFNGKFAKAHGLIRTMPPFNRIRFFHGWAGQSTDFSLLNAIERRGKNTRIQGSGADMTKYALVQVRNYIAENNLPVALIMQVHDQIDTEVHRDYAETWKGELAAIMNEAAKITVTNGLLKVDAEISPVWKK